jgi:hypothetical protein
MSGDPTIDFQPKNLRVYPSDGGAPRAIFLTEAGKINYLPASFAIEFSRFRHEAHFSTRQAQARPHPC